MTRSADKLMAGQLCNEKIKMLPKMF